MPKGKPGKRSNRGSSPKRSMSSNPYARKGVVKKSEDFSARVEKYQPTPAVLENRLPL